MSSPSHPIWSLARLAIFMLALVVTLYCTAAKFDATELRTLCTMFIVGASAEGATQFARSFTKGG